VIGTDCIGSNAREIEHAFSFMKMLLNVALNTITLTFAIY
jgi:hypothetical protein